MIAAENGISKKRRSILPCKMRRTGRNARRYVSADAALTIMETAVNNELSALLAEYSELPEYSEMLLDSVEIKSLFGNKPINIAATRGIISEVEVLLLAGVNVNERGEHGYTPLHDAVEQGHLDVVRLLIKNGADPKGMTDHMVTPVELSIMLQEHQITDYLTGL